MSIQYVKAADIAVNYKDGFSKTELLSGSHEAVRVYKCFLKSGCSVTLDLYEDRFQVFAFVKGIGAVVTESNAYSITEEAYFIPEFNKERVIIQAATDMVFVRYDEQHTEADRISYHDCHMVLPYFRLHSQLLEYDQACKGPNTRSWSIIGHHGLGLGRILMGVVKADGEGCKEKGHQTVAQWNYILSSSELELTVNDETIEQADGDFSYVVAGDDHSLIAKPGKLCSYIWFEYFVNPDDVTRDIIPQEYSSTL